MFDAKQKIRTWMHLKIWRGRILKICKLNSRDLHVIDGIAVFISWTKNF